MQVMNDPFSSCTMPVTFSSPYLLDFCALSASDHHFLFRETLELGFRNPGRLLFPSLLPLPLFSHFPPNCLCLQVALELLITSFSLRAILVLCL